ncbi:MAG: hypothetical protein KBE91_05330 [Bacteroidia bacterium]|nr:hypothetical protein [Bacteroidia bacterium]MBP9689014.1 hypothetical protein [Bacteroidia bacterium]
MKKVFATLTIAGVALVFASCGSETPKTDLNAQEQAAVESTVAADEAAGDMMADSISAMIGTDTTMAAEGHDGHDHEGHTH